MSLDTGSGSLRALVRTALIAILMVLMLWPSTVLASYPADDLDWPSDATRDIVFGGVWSRAGIIENMSLYRLYGFNENFAYYCDETTLTVQPADTRRWATRQAVGAGSVGPDAYGLYMSNLSEVFDPLATVRVWSWGTAFVGKVSGNHSYGQNPAPPRVSGYKWNDHDGDGERDAGEPGLIGWRTRLYKNGVYLATTTTNSSGYYEYTLDGAKGFSPGVYTILEVPQTGWVQTRAPLPVDVRWGPYSAGRNYGGNDFGGFRRATIAGQAWVDEDPDGVRQPLEPAAPGCQIELVSGSTVVATALTDVAGWYQFTILAPGDYVVRQVARAGWVQTYPSGAGTHACSLQSGSAVTSFHFGNRQATGGEVSGTKFADHDADGVRDAGEEGLAGWDIKLDRWTGTEWSEVTSTVTAPDGGYAFTGVSAGAYRLREVQQSHWRQTVSPAEPVTVLNGSVLTGQDFGGIQLGRIRGRVTHDVWKNPLAGVTVRLPATGRTITTGADGYYLFDDVEPNGTFEVPEPSYLVEVDLAGIWRTYGLESKPVTVLEGMEASAGFALYDNWLASTPETVGFWIKWDKQYSTVQMTQLVAKVNAASPQFAALTVAQVTPTLKYTPASPERTKSQAELLATWLNMASGRLGFDTQVNLGAVSGATALFSCDVGGYASVLAVAREVETFFANGLPDASWRVVRELLVALNGGQVSASATAETPSNKK